MSNSDDYDCSQLKGRLRHLCQGHDDAGVPVQVDRRQLAAYREYFRSGGLGASRKESARKLSFGEREAEKLAKSREAWRQLHAYSGLNAENWDAAEAEKWLAEWEKLIPKYGCQCRKHWQAIKSKVPPAFVSAVDFDAWAVNAHNAVNAQLGKPQYPY